MVLIYRKINKEVKNSPEIFEKGEIKNDEKNAKNIEMNESQSEISDILHIEPLEEILGYEDHDQALKMS